MVRQVKMSGNGVGVGKSFPVLYILKEKMQAFVCM